MNKILHYYTYDPLCGWCYGAMPAVSDMFSNPGFEVELLPSGLFSGAGARPMGDNFAAFAWANDQRIASSTGQKFSEHYQTRVLGDRAQRFDSAPATLALSAVALTVPARELEALKAIQRARFIDGSDVTSLPVLVTILESLGLNEAAALLAQPGIRLLDANRARVERAQALMREVGARGVPTLIVESGRQRSILPITAGRATPPAAASQ